MTTTNTAPASTPCRACHVARMLDADDSVGGEFFGASEHDSREAQVREAGAHTCAPEHNTTITITPVTVAGALETWTVAGDSEWDVDADDDGRAIGDFRFNPCEARGPNGETVAFSTCLDRKPRPGAWEAFEAWCERFAGDHYDPNDMAECLVNAARVLDDERVARLDREAMARGDYGCFC